MSIKAKLTIIILFQAILLTAGKISVVPMPMEIREGVGVFRLKTSTTLLIDAGNKELMQIAKTLVQKIAMAGGPPMVINDYIHGKKIRNAIVLSLKGADISLGREGYTLEITKKSIQIRSIAPNGIYYAIQTLMQLLPPEIEKPGGGPQQFSLPVVSVRDKPRYSYRGLHLDVGRHMFPVSFIKKYIDLMSTYKMNTFHWHLTEDQGWRIEIMKYPRLTQVGSTRQATVKGKTGELDGIPYGGFYTQEQIKDIVAYAATRYVNIIPEIEMPGHSIAALTAYPDFSCTGGPFTVRTKWGIADDIFCAGNDSAFLFLENVLTEVISLFPSRYIHIGGDEAPKVRWKACPKCQARILKEGLKDELELQSYFIKRIERFLSSKGRNLIGWDEILEGGLAPEATVMSWRGMQGGIDAASQGHDVIMTPGEYCYFDHYQADPANEPLAIGGYTTLKTVYSFEPTPDLLAPEHRQHILGAQGNVWTEYIKTPEMVEYMAYPRAIALAEVTWSKRESRNWEDFLLRMDKQFQRLDYLGVNYSKGSVQPEITTVRDSLKHRNLVSLSSENRGYQIRYTTDGSDPGAQSTLYISPFEVLSTSTVKAILVKDGIVKGKSNERKILVNLASGKPVKILKPYSINYPASGQHAMTDGLTGTMALKSGWQGYKSSDMEVVIDLIQPATIKQISTTFLQDIPSWILYPQDVEFLVSIDGFNWQSAGNIHTDPLPSKGKADRDFTVNFDPTAARYVKVKAKNNAVLPEWHEYKGEHCWIFVDEISVN